MFLLYILTPCQGCIDFSMKHNGHIYEMLGLRSASLSAVTKVGAGQKGFCKHLNPNVLYMMLAKVVSIIPLVCELNISKCTQIDIKNYENYISRFFMKLFDENYLLE